MKCYSFPGQYWWYNHNMEVLSVFVKWEGQRSWGEMGGKEKRGTVAVTHQVVELRFPMFCGRINLETLLCP